MRNRTRGCGIAIALATTLSLPAIASCAEPPGTSSGCSRPALRHGDRLEQSLEVDGIARAFLVDAPHELAPGQPVPLLFDFHGLGHSGAGVWKVSGFRDLARRAPFLTIYPEGLPVRLETPSRVFEGVGWDVRTIDGNRDLAFVRAMLTWVEREYCVDLTRVYATGFSNGAYLSQLLACTMSDRFAAIAPVSGGRLGVSCKPERPVPVILHHGRRDDLIDVEQARRARDTWLEIDGCTLASSPSPEKVASPPSTQGGSGPRDGITCSRAAGCRGGATVEYCEGDFAHRWPPSATERVWSFLLAHPMQAATP